MSQILVGQQSTIQLTTYSAGAETDLGTFTLGVVDANGTEVVAPGTAVTDGSDGTYTYQLDPQTHPRLLVATWTEGGGNLTFVTYYEVVGALLFTEAAARDFDDDRLTSSTKFDDAAIATERQRITDWLEAETGRSWIPRYRRAVLRGSGSAWLNLRHAIRTEGGSGGEGSTRDILNLLAVTINNVAQDVADFDVEGHSIYRSTGSWVYTTRPQIVVEYVYGLNHPVDGVDRIALLELADRLPASRLSRNAVSSTDEFGSYGWDPQNNGRPSRIAEVNAWVRSHDLRVMLG